MKFEAKKDAAVALTRFLLNIALSALQVTVLSFLFQHCNMENSYIYLYSSGRLNRAFHQQSVLE